MRLAPVPLFYARRPQEAIEKSGESSRTTYGAATAVDACRFLGGLLVSTVQGATKEELLSDRYCPLGRYWEANPLVKEIEEVAAGSFKRRRPPEIQGSGYVVESLEAALWAFYHSNSYPEGCLLAVNLGGDTDTTAAVYGQLAGAFYGEQEILGSWGSFLPAHSNSILTGMNPDDYNRILETTPLSKVMLRNPTTIGPTCPIREAAQVLYSKRIGCLPVIENGDLVGIITTVDLLGLLSRILEAKTSKK